MTLARRSAATIWSARCCPTPITASPCPVLQHVLVEAGVYLIENLALAEPARDRRGSFGFVLLATKYLGTPIALV
jgi:hypothetical protein